MHRPEIARHQKMQADGNSLENRGARHGAGGSMTTPALKRVSQRTSFAAIAASDKSLVELALSTWGLLKWQSGDYLCRGSSGQPLEVPGKVCPWDQGKICAQSGDGTGSRPAGQKARHSGKAAVQKQRGFLAGFRLDLCHWGQCAKWTPCHARSEPAPGSRC